MFVITYLFLVLTVSEGIWADINVKDYVYWAKADISAWHQYFPSRLLEEERLTNLRAAEVVATLVDDIETSLAATVRYQAQELETAQFIMEGTSAQGCVNGISTYMDKAIAEGVSNFQDCVADVVPTLQRYYTSWTKTNASYHAAYQRVLLGIDSCVRTYPNRDSWGRLKTCVDSWTNNYFTLANSTARDMTWSPAMGKFTYTAANCAQTTMPTVVVKGWNFLNMLVQCAKLSENVDAEEYEKQLTSEFNKYTTMSNLIYQISQSQRDIAILVQGIEQEMLHYYDIQKRALENYVIASRNQSYYYGQLVGYFEQYLNTIASTSVDNPANAECVEEAKYAFDNLLNEGAVKAVECDIEIVNNTKLLIARVNQNFLQINDLLPYVKNVAIISCFGEGYIYADNTILNCVSLTSNSFIVNITELNAKIVGDVEVLQGYEKSFYSNSSLPCGNTILSRAIVDASRVLYNLQRCLYINTGTKYAVTTPTPYTRAPTTTTVGTSTTTPTFTTTTWTTATSTIPPQTTTYSIGRPIS